MLSPEDRFEINDVLALHAHIFDTDQLTRVEQLFTADAVYDMTAVGLGSFSGVEAIRAAAARLAGSGHAPLAHFVTNIVLTDDGDGAATALSKGLMIHADGRIEGVTHDDALRRDHGHWRISRRAIWPARPRPAGNQG